MFAQYPYRPLSIDRQEIRILVFDPIDNVHDVNEVDSVPSPGTLSCSLQTVSLLDHNLEPYASISYFWGDVIAQSEIRIDGHHIAIPRNSELALRHFHNARSHGEAGTKGMTRLWMDAVCINQRNREERAAQVRLMARIYTRAYAVLAFTGPTYENVDAAFRSIRLLVDQARAAAGEDDVELHKLLTMVDPAPVPVPEGVDLFALKELYGCPWIRRQWVIQEVALGREVYFYRGLQRVPLMEVITAGLWLCKLRYWNQEIPGRNIGLVTDLQLCTKIYSVRRHTPCILERRHRGDCRKGFCRDGFPLLWLLTTFQAWQTTDPRDKVYGLLGLLYDDVSQHFIVSYAAPTVDVFTTAAMLTLREADGDVTNMLYSTRIHGSRSIAWHVENQWPTWVPHWHLPRRHMTAALPLGAFAAGGTAADTDIAPLINAGYVSGQVLILPGLVVDEVAGLSRPMAAHAEWREGKLQSGLPDVPISEVILIGPHGLEQDATHEIVDQAVRCDNHPPGESISQSLALTLIAGTSLPPTRIIDLPTLEGPLARHLHFPEPEETPRHHMNGDQGRAPYAEILRLRANCRRFITTASGRMGMAPIDCEPGDVVAVFIGVKIPCILRMVANDHWAIVGCAYVHGIMQGECFQEFRAANSLRDHLRTFRIV